MANSVELVFREHSDFDLFVVLVATDLSLGSYGWGTAYILPFFALALALTALATGSLAAGAATILVLAATFFMASLLGLLLVSGSVVDAEREQF